MPRKSIRKSVFLEKDFFSRTDLLKHFDLLEKKSQLETLARAVAVSLSS